MSNAARRSVHAVIWPHSIDPDRLDGYTDEELVRALMVDAGYSRGAARAIVEVLR